MPDLYSKKSGISLLLYKDAQVDQNILDEVFGTDELVPLHQLIEGPALPVLSIRTGETEIMGGQAGCRDRELHRKERRDGPPTVLNAPALTGGLGGSCIRPPSSGIGRTDCSILEASGFKGGRSSTPAMIHFIFPQIGYDENRNINALVIKRIKGSGKVVYTFRGRSSLRRRNHRYLHF